MLFFKNKGFYYIITNFITIIIFSVLYYLSDLYNKEINNPWNYWFYFSLITQTTVGYTGIQFKKQPNYNIFNLKTSLTKQLIVLQLVSIIVINGYFYF
jgi:hypothetical protein